MISKISQCKSEYLVSIVALKIVAISSQILSYLLLTLQFYCYLFIRFLLK